jgi:hypothetical protein
MTERIAALSGIEVLQYLESLSNHLKRQILYFDRVACPQVIYKGAFPDPILNDLEYLSEKDVLRDPGPISIQIRTQDAVNDAIAEEWAWAELAAISDGKPGFYARLVAMLYRERIDKDAIVMPSYISANQMHCEYSEGHKGEQTCLSVIAHLPVPGEDIPLDAILNFRADPEVIRRRRTLIDWQNDMEREGLTPQHLADKLAHLLDDYTTYMKHQSKRFEMGVSETILKVSAEVLEGLFHLKPSKAVEAMFSFKKRKLDLMEAELKAPGREVAYIADAHERFST